MSRLALGGALTVCSLLSLVAWWLPALTIFVLGVLLLIAHDHREAKHRLARRVGPSVTHTGDAASPVVVVMAARPIPSPVAIDAPMVVDAS